MPHVSEANPKEKGKREGISAIRLLATVFYWLIFSLTALVASAFFWCRKELIQERVSLLTTSAVMTAAFPWATRPGCSFFLYSELYTSKT